MLTTNVAVITKTNVAQQEQVDSGPRTRSLTGPVRVAEVISPP